jgi:hypothetical protein
MSISQWILLVLIAVVFCGVCAQAIASSGRSISLGRVALALVVPMAWAALVVLPPWAAWNSALLGIVPRWAREILSPLFALVLLMMPMAALLFVFSITMWVGWALTGEAQDWLRLRWRRAR